MTIITINGLTDEQNETIRDIIENEYITKVRVREAIEGLKNREKMGFEFSDNINIFEKELKDK